MIPPLIARFLPTVDTAIVVTPLALIAGVIAATFVGWLRNARGVRVAYTRKIFHFSIFTLASVVQISWGLHGVVVFGTVITAIVLYAVWRGDGFGFYEAMARPTDAPHRTLFILVPLLTTAIGGGLSNLFFPRFAFIGYLVAGWGDAAGEPVGSRWGRHPYRVPSLRGVPATRTLEGSLAVFAVGATAAMLGTIAAGADASLAIRIAFAAAAAGALVEAVSTHGLDNMTVQIAAAAAASLAV